MTPKQHSLLFTATALLLAASSCKKDELTVVSTATMHTCAKTSMELNVDSLLDCGPDGSKIHYTMCDCDTIAFYPVNLPLSCDFHHWIIDQGQGNVLQNELVLDTITVASELWLDFDDCGPSHLIHILVDTEPCQ